MKNKALKITFALVFIVLIMFSLSANTINTIYAKINDTYGETSSQVVDNNLDKKVNDNPVTGALASFIYSIASLVEYLVGNIFTSISGDPTFPWADRIIFNAVPLLDINFFNPSKSSFFVSTDGSDTPVARMVRNVYFTILAISIAFLTIVVGIAAIKMALTALASEKAKYKEAITKWMFSIVLLFLMHNLMSFIFFLNEGLVKVASGILTDKMNEYDFNKINTNLRGEVNSKTLVDNFFEQNWGIGGADAENAKDFIYSSDDKIEMAAYLLNDPDYNSTILKYASGTDFLDSNFINTLRYSFDMVFGSTGGGMVSKEQGCAPLPSLASSLKCAVDDSTYNSVKQFVEGYNGLSREAARRKFEQDANLNTVEQWITTTNMINNLIDWYRGIVNGAETLRKVFKYDSDSGKWVKQKASDSSDILKMMAEIFKSAAYTYPTDNAGNVTGWSPSKVSVTGAILYAIFVFQSVLYVFSYTKRLFYIIILAIFAPIIVLLDFLGKALM